MDITNDDNDFIDGRIRNKLSESEIALFEEKRLSNPEFEREYVFRKNIVNAVYDINRINQLEKTYQERRKIKKRKTYFSAAAIIGGIIMCSVIFNVFNDKRHKKMILADLQFYSSVEIPITKESYLRDFKEFVNKVEKQSKKYSDYDWDQANKIYKKYSNEFYSKFLKSLTNKNKITIERIKSRYLELQQNNKK